MRRHPDFIAFVELFNRGEFFEAHEALEPLWLSLRKNPEHSFYKGLIQLAGAFVHVRKSRKSPAISLLKLAQGNLRLFPSDHRELDVAEVLKLIDLALRKLKEDQTEGFFPQIRWRGDKPN